MLFHLVCLSSIVIFISCTIMHADQRGSSLPVSVNRQNRSIDFFAIYKPSQFNHSTGLHNHHFIVWDGGKAVENALLVALSPDSIIYDSLLSIGAFPGNNLSSDAWQKRNDPKAKEPDMYAQGSTLSVTLTKGSKSLSISDVIQDVVGKEFQFRFAGNRTLIPIWKSGCVVCLESCPGSKISNSVYTMRDLARGIPNFSVKKNEAINEGDTVIVHVSLSDSTRAKSLHSIKEDRQ